MTDFLAAPDALDLTLAALPLFLEAAALATLAFLAPVALLFLDAAALLFLGVADFLEATLLFLVAAAAVTLFLEALDARGFLATEVLLAPLLYQDMTNVLVGSVYLLYLTWYELVFGQHLPQFERAVSNKI